MSGALAAEMRRFVLCVVCLAVLGFVPIAVIHLDGRLDVVSRLKHMDRKNPVLAPQEESPQSKDRRNPVLALHEEISTSSGLMQGTGMHCCHQGQEKRFWSPASTGEENKPILWFDAPAKDFTDAFPIGNGRIGALVYFKPFQELIVLSDDSLFSGSPGQKRDCSANLQTVKDSNSAHKTAPAPTTSEGPQRSTGGRTQEYEAFLEARKMMMEGRLDDARVKVESMLPEGKVHDFQYLADLMITFRTPLTVMQVAEGKYARRLELEEGVAKARFTAGKCRTKSCKQESILASSAQESVTEMRGRDGRRHLNQHDDTETSDDVPANTLHTHTREAFVSVDYDVVAMRYTCVTDKQEGCADLSFMLRRQGENTVEGVSRGKARAASVLYPAKFEKASYKEVGYHACVTVVVHEDQADVTQGGDDASISVSRAKSVDVFTSASSMYDRKTKTLRSDKLAPKQECMAALDRAVADGYNVVRSAHIRKHKAMFARTDLKVFPKAAHERVRACNGGLTTAERVHMHGRPCLDDDGHTMPARVDVELQQLSFSFGKYLLLASSMPGTQPANLVGLWAGGMKTPWAGDYHININVQMMYWANDVLNLPETFEPINSFMHALQSKGEEIAQCVYGSKGWVAHAFTDSWIQSGHSVWSLCVTCGAWMVTHLWDHYRFTRDDEHLRQHVLPVLSGAAVFFLDYMTPQGPNSTYITGPTLSPENSYRIPSTSKCVQVSLSPAFDTALVYETFTSLLDACSHAGCTSPSPNPPDHCKYCPADLLEAASTTRVRLPNRGFPIVDEKRNGRLAEWLRDMPGMEDYDDEDPGHRHFSTLLPLHPGDQITREHTPELFRAARRTLDWKLANKGGHTGWSAAWAAALFARLEDGRGVQEMIDRVVGRFSLANLLTTHPPLEPKSPPDPTKECKRATYGEGALPADEVYWGEKGGGHTKEDMETADKAKFQLDANLGLLAAVVEALVQSRDRKCVCNTAQDLCECGPVGDLCEIALLPALPSDWNSGSVSGLRTRCGAEVDIEWKDGRLHKATLTRVWGDADLHVRSAEGRLRISGIESKSKSLVDRFFASFSLGGKVVAEAGSSSRSNSVTVVKGLRVGGGSVVLVPAK